MSALNRQEPAPRAWTWLLPVFYMLLIGMYFLLRYQGRWAESDSTVFSATIRDFVREGRLIPTEGEVYPNGYAYQAISLFIISMTGVEVTTLQQIMYPLLAGIVAVPAWTLYREFTGSVRGATIGTIVLLTQPEFLFVILRSSHEKFTRTILIICLVLLIRSFKYLQRPALFALYVGMFYVATYALISINNLLAHSFIFSVALTLGLARMFDRRVREVNEGQRIIARLTYATLVCLGLAYLFTFYAYAPAQHDLQVLHSIYERVAALFLDVEQQSTNPYSVVSAGWVNLRVYFMVSLANWIVLGVSFALWLRQGWRWIVKRREQPGEVAWILWLLYLAFALQGVISALADASGAIGNLQHRVFPSFSIIAVAVVASALADWRPRRFALLAQTGMAALIGCLALLSVFKATNEPTLSNKWTFYRDNELLAIEWEDRYLRDSEIWTEFDERLGMAYFANRGSLQNRNQLFANDLRPTTRSLVVTELTKLRGARLGRALPLPADALRIYDNGEAQVFRLRPETPFQK
ncbi:MAG TPA: hypothetical protein VGE07_18135 [Herpetosiphonaceae bacterium]